MCVRPNTAEPQLVGLAPRICSSLSLGMLLMTWCLPASHRPSTKKDASHTTLTTTSTPIKTSTLSPSTITSVVTDIVYSTSILDQATDTFSTTLTSTSMATSYDTITDTQPITSDTTVSICFAKPDIFLREIHYIALVLSHHRHIWCSIH